MLLPAVAARRLSAALAFRDGGLGALGGDPGDQRFAADALGLGSGAHGLGHGLCSLLAHCQRQNGGARAAEEDALGASRSGGLKQNPHPREDRLAIGLVKAVTGSYIQQIGVAGGEGGHKEGGAPHVVHGVGEVNLTGQHATSRLGGHGEVGHKAGGHQVGRNGHRSAHQPLRPP